MIEMDLDLRKKKVFISQEAYERIVMYGSRYANAEMSTKAWCEVYGVLVGYLDKNNNTIVKTAIPIVSGTGAGVEYETKHYSDTAIIDETVYEKTIKDKSKEFFIGWWHTHPGFGFFFSETDTFTHLGYQEANPFSIGIIYDHTVRNNHDSGLEVLMLEDVSKNILSPYIFIDFEIENSKKAIRSINTKLENLLPKLNDFHLDLMKLDKNFKKKKFAQLQRNYGLLLIQKRKSEMNEDDILSDDEKYLYEWNEDYMKRKYRIPKFRQKIENIILVLKSTQKKKKRENLKNKIEKLLEKPKIIINGIKNEFYFLKDRSILYNSYIDTNERKMLELFEKNITDYIDILNNLIIKALNAKNNVELTLKLKPVAENTKRNIEENLEDNIKEKNKVRTEDNTGDKIRKESEINVIIKMLEDIEQKLKNHDISEDVYKRKKKYLTNKLHILK